MMYQKPGTLLNNHWKHYLLLFLVALITFWPLAIGFFSLKNDALIYFLPWRYHISESIQNGFFPYWTPYLYTGLPLHSDMQSGFWNPIVLFISLFTRYNMTVLQLEVLLYLFIAGIGMYKLLRSFLFSETTCLVVAIAYMCSGFITDSISFIPWITSAAYLPFVFMYFYRLLHNGSTDTAIKLGITLTLLLTAGYPSFFIYSIYILLAAGISWIIVKSKNKKYADVKELLKYGFLASLVFIFVSSPAVISYWEFLEYYQRGKGATLSGALSNSFNLFSTISFITPTAVARPHEYINSDLSARNIYTGFIILIFFLLSFTKKVTGTQKFIIAIIIFSFLFSLGGATPVREWCYRILPFMDSFRHPATIRLFTCLGILILAASAFDKFLSNSFPVRKKILILSGLFTIILIVIMAIYSHGSNIFRKLSVGNYSINGIKQLIDTLTFAELAFVQSLLQLIFILFFFLIILRKNINKRFLSALMIANSIVFAWIGLPYTAVSQVRTSEVNAYLNTFPKGYPPPALYESIQSATNSDSVVISPLGYAGFYNKKISIQDHVITPTLNSNYESFLEQKNLRMQFNTYPYCYFADKSFELPLPSIDSFLNKKIIVFDVIERPDLINNFSKGMIVLKNFNPNKFEFETTNPGFSLFNLFQQYNKNWTATVNGVSYYVYKTNIAFIGILVPPGTNTITFEYKPRYVHSALQITIVTLLIIATHFILNWRKKFRSAHA